MPAQKRQCYEPHQLHAAIAYHDARWSNVQVGSKGSTQGQGFTVRIAVEWDPCQYLLHPRRGTVGVAVDAKVEHVLWSQAETFQFGKVQGSMRDISNVQQFWTWFGKHTDISRSQHF
jgi:hypothetical protein